MNTYKSKDIDYMNKLKKAVLKGMRGHMPDEKQYTWEYVRRQVTLDDLQSYAVSQLGKILYFPTEHLNADIMAIFLHPPTANELDILDKMMSSLQVDKEHIYVTCLGKTEASNEQEADILNKVLEGEITIIKPKLILSFGINIHPEAHIVADFKDAKCLVTYDMNYITKDNTIPLVERKQALWNDVKQLIQYYKS